MATKIGVCAPFLSEKQVEQIKEKAKSNGFEAAFFNGAEQAIKEGPGCEIYFGSFPAEAIKANSALKWMHCSFAGIDKVTDPAIYPHENVIVTNSAGAFGPTISEHMICTIIMMMRRMQDYTRQQDKHIWKLLGEVRSIDRSTITVVGMGDIGTTFAKKVKAMGATVYGMRRTQKPSDPCYDKVFTIDNLDEAIKDADVVAMCVPGTEGTQGIFDTRRFSVMKDGAYLVNIGRGSAIDQAALAEALKSGKLAGAAIDVATPEPLPADHPLWDAPNILITPHASGNMTLYITRERVVDMFCENVDYYAQGKPLRNLADIRIGY